MKRSIHAMNYVRMENVDMKKFLLALAFLAILLFPKVHAQAPNQTVPAPFKVSREGVEPHEHTTYIYTWNELKKGTDKPVMPNCETGEFYVAFKLFYDLRGHGNTTIDWSAKMDLALLHGEDTVWRKPLHVEMTDQTFIATVFRDQSIVCTDDYHFAIAKKDSTGTVPDDFIDMKVLLYKKMTGTFNPAQGMALSCVLDPVKNETAVSWTPTDPNYRDEQPILEYDLEWVFIDSADFFSEDAQHPEKPFQYREPVRITTAGYSYDHLAYYPTGKIWYRVRVVGYNINFPAHRIPGQWWYFTPGIAVSNHTNRMTWQEQVVFAEEGKSKTLMHYFDGSLRERQTLTNLNSERVTLVAESLYDFEGRKSVDILPVPALNASLTYHPGFHNFHPSDPNVDANTSPTQQKFNYDNHRLENSTMAADSGAGNYYSPASRYTSIHKDMIPDGEGYVFSQTEYMRDGTGRVNRQSGVGKEFRADGPHTTQYAYSEATQEELVRLFGSNVGNASHYKKNMVIDPNGQASVSYVDQEGRVIATALAGNKPDNVTALDSYANLSTDSLTIDMRSKNRIEGNVSRASQKILNVAPTSYTFRYNFKALGSDLGALGCSACTYSLGLSLSDPDGAPVSLAAFSGNQSQDPNKYERLNFTAASCADTTAMNDILIKLVLPELGEYTFTKTLTAHELTIEQMQALAMQDQTVQQQIQQLTTQFTSDPADCETCVSACPGADDLINQAIEDIAHLDCDNILQEILSDIREAHATDTVAYEPTQTEIESHVLYCKYSACNQNVESDMFDKRLARLQSWEEAQAAYPSVIDSDPFFNNPALSGAGSKGSMIDKLDNISIGVIGFDSDGDGEEDDSKTYAGPIAIVTNPGNTAFYIDENGKPDTNGKHILYLDLMGQHAQMTEAKYQAELSRQHWTMYRTFYLEAKRKIKLTVAPYTTCDSARAPLERPDEMNGIDTDEKMAAWAKQHGALGYDTVSNYSIDLSLESIRSACGARFLPSDSLAIRQHLSAYLSSSSGRTNPFRTIQMDDVHSNADLIAVQQVLDHYNCVLDSVALENMLVCARQVNVTIYRAPLTPQPLVSPTSGSNLVQTMETQSEVPCATTPAEERVALEEFFNSTNGTAWTNKTGWLVPNSDVSTWYGISTDENGFVTGISLSENNLSGTVPVSFNAFCHYISVSLDNNHLTGEFPLDERSNYSELNLSNNEFTGTAPNLDNWYYYNISHNKFDSLPGILKANMLSGFEADVSDNRLTFADFEDIACYSFDSGTPYSYAPQDSVDVRKTFTLQNSPITLTATVDRGVNPSCKYQWFKYVDGVNDLALNAQSTSGHTYVITNPRNTDRGKYYYTIVYNYDQYPWCDQGVRDLVLTSRFQEILKNPNAPQGTNYTICLKYDSANTALKDFSYDLDWNQQFLDCRKRAEKEDSLLVAYASEQLVEGYINTLYASYRSKCLSTIKEGINYTYIPKEYHYTLYYFDQAKNLVQTVPPKGVHPLSNAQVERFIAGDKTEPGHQLLTNSCYSALNQVLWQKTPDAGIIRFWYDEKVQMRMSQNAQQLVDSTYSYVKYDSKGRVVENGELKAVLTEQVLLDSIGKYPNYPSAEAHDAVTDITKTYYDLAWNGPSLNFQQTNLRTRVSYVETFDKLNANDTVRTLYSYDIHGSVSSLLQDLPGLPTKRTDYSYNLVSGKVNYMMYQYGQGDQFIHKFTYDDDNRLTDVHTSADGFIWFKEATYKFFKHGPTARVELGEHNLQGLDYYYTLQGWIKGVNTPYDDNLGVSNVLDQSFGKDAYAYALGYFQDDFKSIDNSRNTVDSRDKVWTRHTETYQHGGLFNGNVAWIETDLVKIGQIAADRSKGMQAMLYQYDQLHRLVNTKSLTEYSTAGFSSRSSSSGPYDETFSYDANGNFMTLVRNDEAGTLMDNFNYQYYAATNRLREAKPITRNKVVGSGEVATDNVIYSTITLNGGSHVSAGKTAEVKALENIVLDPDFSAYQDADFWAHIVEDDGTYQYDAIGNLIKDQDQGLQISWTPAGLIREVHLKGDSLVMSYKYDGAGNRVEKKTAVRGAVSPSVTNYVRDAKGTVLAIYVNDTVVERPIYGNDRIGFYEGVSKEGSQVLGERKFELSNHLKSILSVISDSIVMQNGVLSAAISSAGDYYAYGFEMKGRTVDANLSRYGFNGKEREVKDESGSRTYDYGFRIDDPRIGRFLSIDPKHGKYPGENPYMFCSGNPIVFMDPDGQEKIVVIGGGDNTGNDPNKFINSGLLQVMNYLKSNPKENVTIVITDIFVSEETMASLQGWANALTINANGTSEENTVAINLVRAASGDEITNYINSKTTNSDELSDARTQDQITDLSFFGHGYGPLYSSQGRIVGAFEPGHGTPGEDIGDEIRPKHDKWAWGIEDVERMATEAFANDANVDFYSCNPGTPNYQGNSLVSLLSTWVPQAKVTGFYGRSDYLPIYRFENRLARVIGDVMGYFTGAGNIRPAQSLPVAGKKTGTELKSEKVTYKGGVKQP
jgi:RHS repeat-associated protein